MKKVYISWYNGDLFIETANNTSRNKIYQKALEYFQPHYNNLLQLPNFEYYTEKEYLKEFENDIHIRLKNTETIQL